MQEEWKYIRGFGRDYKISNTGRVLRMETTYETYEGIRRTLPEKELSASMSSNGKLMISLRVDIDEHVLRTLARLVLKTFTTKPQKYRHLSYRQLVVRYKDDDARNVHLSNLEWISQQEAVTSVYAANNRFIKRKRKESKVPQYESRLPYGILTKDRRTGKVREHSSIVAVSIYLNVSYGRIRNALINRGLSGQAWTNCHIVKLDDGNPWPEFTQDLAAYLGNLQAIPATVYNPKTEKQEEFKSLTSLAKKYKVPISTVYHKMRTASNYSFELGRLIVSFDGRVVGRVYQPETLRT